MQQVEKDHALHDLEDENETIGAKERARRKKCDVTSFARRRRIFQKNYLSLGCEETFEDVIDLVRVCG